MVMVLLTEKYNLREASCCSVEVVKGAVGLFLAGFVSFDAIENCAFTFSKRKSCTSSG